MSWVGLLAPRLARLLPPARGQVLLDEPTASLALAYGDRVRVLGEPPQSSDTKRNV